LNAAEVIAALEIPPGARVDRRVPRTLLVEHGAPTAADRRRINEGIESVQWVATLKPLTIGVPAFRDEVREYLEINVLSATLRAGAKAARLAELIHRAVPYPTLLITHMAHRVAEDAGHQPDKPLRVSAPPRELVFISLAHKRWSQGQVGATVLDGELIVVAVTEAETDGLQSSFRQALSLARQPHADLYQLYQGWIDTLLALKAATVTGRFAVPTSADQAAARREALREWARLDAEIARLRKAAAKERQVPRQVELNLELKRAEAARAEVGKRL
jgi:hypothetical protein